MQREKFQKVYHKKTDQIKRCVEINAPILINKSEEDRMINENFNDIQPRAHVFLNSVR